ncbi:MAG TPA: hypothetical protein VK612_03055 [Pyrinomonadaceae bacterium]|nr:hypothetical protein [Pyrinomonadaceae bacterium]
MPGIRNWNVQTGRAGQIMARWQLGETPCVAVVESCSHWRKQKD